MESTDTTLASEPQSGRYSFESQTYKRTLLRPITRDEEVRIAREIADKNDAIDRLMAEKERLTSEKAGVSKDIETLQDETRVLSRDVHRGQVEDAIDCRYCHDTSRLAVIVIRLDTGELVEERPMNDDEVRAAQNPTLPGVELAAAVEKRAADYFGATHADHPAHPSLSAWCSGLSAPNLTDRPDRVNCDDCIRLIAAHADATPVPEVQLKNPENSIRAKPELEREHREALLDAPKTRKRKKNGSR